MSVTGPREPQRPPLDPAQIASGLEAVARLARQVGARWALAGGIAFMDLGSPRFTSDIDIVSDRPLPLPEEHPLTFGGSAHQLPTDAGPVPLDWILRNDDYEALYEEALLHATSGPDGIPRIRPEYLAAMKFAARRAKDETDLLWLLKQGKVDIEAARRIVKRHVGGRFGLDEFDSFVTEAEWQAREENPRDY